MVATLQSILPGLVAEGVQQAMRTVLPRIEMVEQRFDFIDAKVDGLGTSLAEVWQPDLERLYEGCDWRGTLAVQSPSPQTDDAFREDAYTEGNDEGRSSSPLPAGRSPRSSSLYEGRVGSPLPAGLSPRSAGLLEGRAGSPMPARPNLHPASPLECKAGSPLPAGPMDRDLTCLQEEAGDNSSKSASQQKQQPSLDDSTTYMNKTGIVVDAASTSFEPAESEKRKKEKRKKKKETR